MCLKSQLLTKKSQNLLNRIHMSHKSLYLRIKYIIVHSHCLKHLLITKRDFSWPSPIFNVIQSTAEHQEQPCIIVPGGSKHVERTSKMIWWLTTSCCCRGWSGNCAFKESDEWISGVHVDLLSWIKISLGCQKVFSITCASPIQTPNCAELQNYFTGQVESSVYWCTIHCTSKWVYQY